MWDKLSKKYELVLVSLMLVVMVYVGGGVGEAVKLVVVVYVGNVCGGDVGGNGVGGGGVGGGGGNDALHLLSSQS